MAIHNFFIFLFLSIVHAQNTCPTSYCNNNSLEIQFPFWLQGEQLPKNCQPIGFNLSCNGQKKLILNIPSYGDFQVSYIYYYIRRVTLSDPDNCLPKKLLSSNLSYSPFMAVSRYYTFFSCPKGQGSSRYVVDCLSNATTDTVVLNYEASIFLKCEKIVTLALPVSTSSFDYRFPVYFDLTWNDPGIGEENKRSLYRNSSSSILLVIPVVIVGISLCICMMRRNNPQDNGSNQASGRAGLPDTVTPGQGISTIETYRKITVGESRGIEGPNDITCAICLADYVPKDTIKFMPECQHCFHVECIDKWLSIKAKCPICRTSQT